MITLRVLKSSFKNCLYLWVWESISCEKESIDEISSIKLEIKEELKSLSEKVRTNFENKVDKSCSIDELNILKNELKIFRFTWKSKEELVKWTSIKLDFSKKWNENFYLSELPDEINSIEYKWQIYNRAIWSRKWEFISDKFEILKSEDKMEFTIKDTRDKNNISEKARKDNESIEKNKSPLDKAIILKIKERWFNDKILIDEVKKWILSDEEWIISDIFEGLKWDEKTKKEKEFNDFMLEKYPWYPNNLSKLNEKIDELLSEYRYNKWAYYTPKKLLEEIAEIKNEKQQEEKVREILQPQVELAIKTSPENWTDKISTENPEIEAMKWSPIFQLLNLFFKWILWVDFFKSLWQDYDEGLNDPEKAKEMVWSLIWWQESEELGSVSETFESGGEWPYAINGNDWWLPSFWTYQLHGWMLKEFANSFTVKDEPKPIKWNYAEIWKETIFAKNWKLAIESVWVDEFRKKEHEFIKKTHYDKQVNKISRETFWVNPNNFSMSLKNVIWSVSVQHWADSEIVVKAIENLWKKLDYSDLNNQKKLIEEIYKVRTNVFPRDSERYKKEKYTALQNLNINLSELTFDNKGQKINIPKGIISFPKEYSNSWTTLCSRTACKNLTQVFWINAETWSSAMEVKSKSKIESFPPNNWWKVADLFMSSLKYPQYWHRAVAFVDNWNWFVLDPYLPVNWNYTRNPILWETYKSYLDQKWRKFFWAKIY